MQDIEPTSETLHGKFSPELDPVATVAPGESIACSTLDISWGRGQHDRQMGTRDKFEPEEREINDGPALCGPVAVEGAEPGDTLAITFETIRPVDWGWTYSGPGFFNESINEQLGLGEGSGLMLWQLDRDEMVAESETGHTVEMEPFLGTIGMPPPEPGLHSGWFPRIYGGNMDCAELVEGTTLYLPVGVEGGLVSLGDGHARQGDGELCGTAIECPMERVQLRFDVVSGVEVPGPRVQTDEGWVALGFDEDLDEAVVGAIANLLDLLVEATDLSRREACMLASVRADVRATQIVNGVRGAHVVWPGELDWAAAMP